ncbi:MAG: hypothetical protein ACXU9U_03210 [Parachlamydiaceae bacterium]
MAKKNFTKVEDLLEAGLAKIKANRWGKIADIAQRVERPEMRKFVEKANAAAEKSVLDRTALIHSIHHAIKEYRDPQLKFYESIGIEKEQLQTLLVKKPEELTAEDEKCLQSLRLKIQEFKKVFLENHPEERDEGLVEKERRKHINKRFNVNNKWLPLK